MEKKNWETEKMEEIIKKSGEQEEIPESLRPENMRKLLEENAGTKKKRGCRKWYGMAAAAACLVLVLFVGKSTGIIPEGLKLDFDRKTVENGKTVEKSQEKQSDKRSEAEQQESGDMAGDVSLVAEEYDTSYDELYDFFHEKEKEYERTYGKYEDEVIMEESKEIASDQSTGQTSDSEKQEYADTNRQEEGVDEADTIKNDGRYLYQIVTNEDYSQSVQITDTQGGLREAARIDGFDNIFEMYIWKDTLVLMESAWAETETTEAAEYGEMFLSENEVCYDMAGGTSFQKVYIYNIKDRANPKEEHMFTMRGSYLDSRVTDGYLYCFLNSGVDKLEGRRSYEDYVPVLEGKAMSASSIYMPEEADDSNYLVIATVDLRFPEKFKDTKAVVTSADHVYVTDSDIYVTDNVYDAPTEEENVFSNKTNIIRFYYADGILRKEAEGSVKGVLLDDMAINESNGYLRMAVTIDSYRKERVRDDILGYFMGYETTEDKRDNSLYVLDESLAVVGKIEGMAEEERIYSARFMGNTGYFVTFRQTDPLFSVDLSDPSNPKVLGELKISGFSEYLHFYSEDKLLGIGMEADEDTGITQGMKLSMFDISNPADVKEQDKYDLSEYDYSESLYNYKHVMIDTEKNLFGFYAEDYGERYSNENGKQAYLLFSYENGAFQQKMKIACNPKNDKIGYCGVRGTYIGDVFYLLYGDGRIESYSLTDGSRMESLAE